MQIFPNITQRFTDTYGTVLKPWIQYLQQFTQAPPAFSKSTVNESPFTYTAKEPGFVSIVGGTISKIVLTRGNIDIVVTGSLFVPVGIHDIVTITYSVAPSVNFIPSYGANTIT